MEKEIEVAALGATATSESIMRMAVAEARSEFQAQLDHTRAESQCRDADTKQKMDEIAVNLATLTDQLNRFKPASVAEVSGSQNQLLQDVDVRLQTQAQRIDTVTDSVQKIERDSADNTKLLHDLLISMENLGESLKQIKSEVKAWEENENPMETDEDALYRDMQKSILEEVSQSFPYVGAAENTSASTPISMPVQLPAQILSEPSTSDLPESADERMREQLDNLRAPVNKGEITSKGFNSSFRFSTPASATLPYPGLDGHPRRITPIPVSVPLPPIEKPLIQPVSEPLSKFGWYWSELAQGWYKTTELVEAEKRAGIHEGAGGEEDTAPNSQISGINRSTIGNTTISTAEASKI